MIDPFSLNLRHLRALEWIVRAGGIGAAANAVGLSQPALTQGLAKLETQLGVRLFERLPDGMKETLAGQTLIDRVEAAFAYLSAGSRSGGRGFSRPEHLMTATQLRALLALVDAGSFVAAGQSIHLSQPAVHRSVRDLEQVTGSPLLERRGRGVLLTGAGRRLARAVRLARGELVAAILELQPGEGGGRVVIGAMPVSRAELVPDATARLVKDVPGVEVSIVEGSWRELVDLLREGLIDLMIGALRAELDGDLIQASLLDDRPVVVAGARHPLARAAHVTSAQLAAFPWIVGHGGSPLRQNWETLFGAVRPPRPIECGSVMVIRGLLTAGDFLTLLSPAQVALEVAAGVLAHVGGPLAADTRTIGITMRRDWRPTAAQRRFVDLLHEATLRSTDQENE